MPLGERWVNLSYDYLFRFGARSVTNKVALVLMDDTAYYKLGQERGKPWDRRLHADLLNKLTDDGCPLVVFDVFFFDRQPNRGQLDPHRHFSDADPFWDRRRLFFGPRCHR